MKHILTILTLIFASAALNAQIMNPSMVQKGSRVFLDEEKLAKADLKKLEGFDFESYQTGKKNSTMGITAISFGAVSGGVAIIALFEMEPQAGQPANGIAGMTAICCGSVAILLEAVGIPLYFSGKKKIKASVDKYNQGLTLAYTF